MLMVYEAPARAGLLPGDEPIMVEVVDGECVAELLLEAALEEHVEAHHPLLPADQAAPPQVEELEHPVHQDVVRHVEGLVQEVLEGHPVHGVRLLRLGPI